MDEETIVPHLCRMALCGASQVSVMWRTRIASGQETERPESIAAKVARDEAFRLSALIPGVARP